MASFSNITGKVPTLLTSIVAIGRVSMGGGGAGAGGVGGSFDG